MEALKVGASCIAAAILMVAVYVSGVLLGWLFLLLSILAIIVSVFGFIAYAIYDGFGYFRRSQEARKEQ